MPNFLSVIVPAWNVQGYLTECLDSVLRQQRVTEVELVAVDDASPDHVGELLDERAAADPRLVALHLDSNGGPGAARNAGLDRATGEYVWFVDGDDRIVPDSLAVIEARILEEKPDVLVVGVARERWNRKVSRWLTPSGPRTGAEALTVAAPPVGALLVRRQFLVDSGIRFERGLYEDVSFAYAVLAATDNVATVEPACYVHRLDRQGSSRSGRSARHADAVTQYDRALSLPVLAAASPEVRRRAVHHAAGELYRILDKVPAKARRGMFDRISELLRKHEAGSPAAGSYPAYRVLRAGRRLAGGLIRKPRRALRSGRVTLRKAGLRAYYHWQLRLPIDENLAVYGAYWYRGYSCNPAAIYEKARELVPQVRGVWVVKPGAQAVPADVPTVAPGTRAYFRTLARAKYMINNATFPPYVVKRQGQIQVQTHHGTPLKTMGLDQPRFPASLKNFNAERMRRNLDKWDFSVTANRHTTLLWDRQFPIKGETLETGYPRNDRLALATDRDVAAARAELGIEPGEQVVLYAPTHREWHSTFTSLLDVDALAEALGPNARILLRGHYFYDSLGFPPQHPRVLDVSTHPSVETLAIASDALITDFSSVMFDYAVLDRPVIIFAPDWEIYQAVRGVSFDLEAEHPGTFVRTFDELVDAFRSGAIDDEPARRARTRFRQRFCSLEDGHAAERVVRRVFLNEKIDG
ncbi:bifunctional glycosyltransferase/CDP-glycerol:glycerophosphate glycerophosphotransferase [Actinoplanes aureus]|uniref:CDP-glycerol glycerophosphotransferase family protein n=1 Tax=Actinoplanes aureus TaxID=2792083 RepID=A0A931C589_9ACTN|nr:bifunctional glycosyltransferase family 2 protein/CDP-glycerol:glycerophosphate glycerophosphotransferase [Actinoplanes aureus]MBG0561617.1 CDP-glycerol glycerophosphotransferase family protein [Actinoplanes aureus]